MASHDHGSRVTSRRSMVSGIALVAVAIVGAVGFLLVHRPAPTAASVAVGGSSTTAGPVAEANAGPAATTVGPTTVVPTAGPPAATVGPTTVVPTAAPPAATAMPPAPTTTVPPGPPHFATPQAAMTYLAAAWNRGDTVDLDHVTTPAGRADLAAMRSEAVDLRLDHCTGRPQGDYLCYFDHGYRSGPATAVTAAANPMVVLVGPARTPGWYMTVFISCG